MRFVRITATTILLGCVAPTTQQVSVSPDVVRAEQLKQQQLVIRSEFTHQQRLDDVSLALLRAAVPLCGNALGPRRGIRFANVHSFNKDYRAAARQLGFSDTLSVTVVARGSAAERSGFRVGDQIVALGGEPTPIGPRATSDFAARLAAQRQPLKGAPQGTAQFTVLRSALLGHNANASVETAELNVPMDTVCSYDVVVAKDDAINAYADGRNVVVTSGMMRFASSEDDLAVVVAHEIGHNAMGHIKAKRANATVGALLGAIFDVAAATQGVNTGGDFASLGAEFGAMTFSQDFEREADYVGLYILARADRTIENSPDFWRRMALESPGSIKFASSHPTTAERFVRLEGTVGEINRKRAELRPLMPEMKTTGSDRRPD